jgi:hypothetical protein
MKEKPDKDAAKNVDPLTGEPGVHPVGAGVGAAGGGVGRSGHWRRTISRLIMSAIARSRPLPWDRARHATRAAWMKVSGAVAPRDTERGI